MHSILVFGHWSHDIQNSEEEKAHRIEECFSSALADGIEVYLHLLEGHMEWKAVHLLNDSVGHQSKMKAVEVHHALIGMAPIAAQIEEMLWRLSAPRYLY